MKSTLTLSLLLILAGFISLNAQSVTVSVGASYANQAYYTLETDAVATLANESWDLAFSTGDTDGGIFINEAVKAVFSGPVPDLRLFLAPSTDFSEPINPASLTDSLFNPEADWQNGALNSFKDDLDPSDYGWGFYDSGDNSVIGIRVFALQLRDDTWIKFKVESLIDGVYTMRYADLDGANETVVTLDKADFAGSPLALFSFDTGTAEASPAGWDLLFTRYQAALGGVGPDPLQYQVTGVLSGPGVEVAEAQGVNPATVNHEDYLDSLDSRLDIIGQDWKEFNLNLLVWVIDTERAYFAKLANNQLWKLVFTGFGGSSNGNFIFQKTYLGEISSVEEPGSNFTAFNVFPNPVSDELSVVFSLKEGQTMPVALVNSLGQVAWRTAVTGQTGMNALSIHTSHLPAGVYSLTVGAKTEVVSVQHR